MVGRTWRCGDVQVKFPQEAPISYENWTINEDMKAKKGTPRYGHGGRSNKGSFDYVRLAPHFAQDDRTNLVRFSEMIKTCGTEDGTFDGRRRASLYRFLNRV